MSLEEIVREQHTQHNHPPRRLTGLYGAKQCPLLVGISTDNDTSVLIIEMITVSLEKSQP